MFKNSLELLKCDIHNGATGKLIDPGRRHFQTHHSSHSQSADHTQTHAQTSSAMSATQLTEPAESGGNTRQRGDPSEPDNTRTLTSETS